MKKLSKVLVSMCVALTLLVGIGMVKPTVAKAAGATTESIVIGNDGGGYTGTMDAYPNYLLSVALGGHYDFNVKQIQMALNVMHGEDPSIPAVVADGYFGTNTKNAIIAFQNSIYGRVVPLSVDGIVGKSTWDVLRRNANYFIAN